MEKKPKGAPPKKRPRTRSAKPSRITLCEVTGLRGGTSILSVDPKTQRLEIGMRSFEAEDLELAVKDKGERRAARRALFRNGFTSLAARSLKPCAMRIAEKRSKR